MRFASLAILALAPFVLCDGQGTSATPPAPQQQKGNVPDQDLNTFGQLPPGFKLPTEVPENIPLSTIDAVVSGNARELAQATANILIKKPKPATPIPEGADKLRALMSSYNKLSYCPTHPTTGEKDPIWTKSVHVEKQNPLGYHVVAVDDVRKNIVVAFRGSMNLEVRGNLMMFTQVPPAEWVGATLTIKGTNKIAVHQGCWIGYQTVRKALIDRIGALLKEKPGYSLAITGYSYGAPLAVYAATDMRLKFKDSVTNLVTFGGPRPGNAGYSAFLNHLFNSGVDWSAPKNAYLRVVRLRDPYPLIPPPTLAFVHGAGQEVLITDDDKFLFCDTVAGLEDPNCATSILKENLINPGDGIAHESAHHKYWEYMTCGPGETYEEGEGDFKVDPDKKKKLELEVFKKFLSSLNLTERLAGLKPKVKGHRRAGKTPQGANEWS